MLDPRKYGYKRLETDEEFRERILKTWRERVGLYNGGFVDEVMKAKGEDLDCRGWTLYLQRRIIDVY